MSSPRELSSLGISHAAPPLDFSFKCLAVLSDISDEEPRDGIRKLRYTRQDKPKAVTNAFRLNNNSLCELSGFAETLASLVDNPDGLLWIDISFNDLTTIDPVLPTYRNLRVLYLHGNNISNLCEVEKLAQLSDLRSLTLHGNSIENEKGYRHMVLAMIPQLKTLDFSGITKSDRATSLQFKNRPWAKKTKKKAQVSE
ncbi:PREDICTED: leucine-rich repeat-containing protein 51-like [Priapulus caudatus]|uniref:Leucine-rich repeat-containing protein 51 n=1 Tax=Priapulus caudatus TaxID=37621 RepID=A0ABM1EG56_PRICU|nr:PREDICTED: leucine-rich repeat-containing protein 51-like [Priapulus caudatus]